MKPLTIVIVDDESLARQGLRHHLREIEGVEIIAEFGDSQRALNYLQTARPDLLLVDIEMPGMTGMVLVEKLADPLPAVAFVTAFDQYAIEAFRHQAIDYLLKPVDVERLGSVVAMAATRRERTDLEQENRALRSALYEAEQARLGEIKVRYNKVLAIKDRGQTVRVEVEAIDWIEAAGDYMCVHSAGETHVLRSTMRKLVQQFDPQQFVRVHRSALINVKQIKAIASYANGEYRITLATGDVVKTSRRYKQAIRQLRQSG